MEGNKVLKFTSQVLKDMPRDWLNLTTHRLDIYEEKLAKTQFLQQFENLFYEQENANQKAIGAALSELPTAYDYIRLGHPLSCVLEWLIAKRHGLKPEKVICFSSQMAPILAILRTNLLNNKKTRIFYKGELPDFFNAEIIKSVYGYKFDLEQIENIEEISKSDSTILISRKEDISVFDPNPKLDFLVNINNKYGSILLINDDQNDSYISEIQHVRRRETIAMTPADCHALLKYITSQSAIANQAHDSQSDKTIVEDLIKEFSSTLTKPLIGSSGLSVQYAIMMGLIDHAQESHQGKAIKFVVPPNCYGGTNDQARRVAACKANVEVVDLPVDGENDMVQSLEVVLNQIAKEDAIPFIIAEIPTNPRVEVPDLLKLKEALSKKRITATGENAIDPVFILDQTFCPNVHFLGEGKILSTVKTIAYISGSKFPSGGLCTAGFCIGNNIAKTLMHKIEVHLKLCDNQATDLQLDILAKQLPSMKRRVSEAYYNTRDFVNFISDTLPKAKINFVSEDLAKQGFTPSVFSLDLPTHGKTEAEKESNKRALNLKLINLMISKIPDESKFCVSYGQLKGCYWTIPATSTQGTTKEGDKDYIVRVSVSPKLNLDLHKKVFLDFVKKMQ